MALSDSSLKQKILDEMKALGFVTTGEFAKNADFAEAIAKAVIAEITENAQVVVASGSSAGTYDVT